MSPVGKLSLNPFVKECDRAQKVIDQVVKIGAKKPVFPVQVGAMKVTSCLAKTYISDLRDVAVYMHELLPIVPHFRAINDIFSVKRETGDRGDKIMSSPRDEYERICSAFSGFVDDRGVGALGRKHGIYDLHNLSDEYECLSAASMDIRHFNLAGSDIVSEGCSFARLKLFKRHLKSILDLHLSELSYVSSPDLPGGIRFAEHKLFLYKKASCFLPQCPSSVTTLPTPSYRSDKASSSSTSNSRYQEIVRDFVKECDKIMGKDSVAHKLLQERYVVPLLREVNECNDCNKLSRAAAFCQTPDQPYSRGSLNYLLGIFEL